MSHYETHRLCNKLEKWINNSCMHHNHSKNSQTEGTHLNYNAKNSRIYCSPYKKTSFETLLRKYPKNEQETKNLPKSNSQRQNQQNYGMKRTFESRMMNFQNVKSKIDTNLHSLKQFKMKQQNIPCPNDQNKNVMNMNIVQQLVDKEMIQNDLRKKIKLSTGQYESFQVKKSNVWVKNDENNLNLMNKATLQVEGIKIKGQRDGSKGLFKINVSKRINMFGMNNSKEENNNLSIFGGQKKQTPEQQSDEINCLDERVRLQQIEIREKQFINERQYEVSGVFFGQPLLHSSGDTRLVFKQLKEENRDHLQSDDEAQDGIFCFDGYRMTEPRDHQQQEEQSNYINNNSNDLQAVHSDLHHQIQMETIRVLTEISTDEIIDQSNNLQHSLQEILPKTENNSEIIPVSDHQVTMLQALELLQDIPDPQAYLNHQPYPQIIQQTHTQNAHLLQLNNQSFNNNHTLVEQKEIPLTFRPKFQRPKREKKSKDNTKILTRSKEDKLHLFNKLSMRLIRKKYGQDLTHTELVEKLLQDQGKIHLKAFIQDHQRKTVFQFNQLTETQMKTILMKYFDQEESKNEETE